MFNKSYAKDEDSKLDIRQIYKTKDYNFYISNKS